jgi:hypothetical protein
MLALVRSSPTLRWALLSSLLLGFALRAFFLVTSPISADEFHRVSDALWAHPRFPGDRVAFVHDHAARHLVLEPDRWSLVEHGLSGHPTWDYPRVGHTNAFGLVLGALSWPFLHDDGRTPWQVTTSLVWAARVMGGVLDLGVLLVAASLAARRWGIRAGAATALFHGLSPWAAAAATQGRADTFVAASLIAAAALMSRERGAVRDVTPSLASAGALIGLAVAFKQTAGLFLLLPLLALLGGPRPLRRLVLVGVVAVGVAGVVSDPFRTVQLVNQAGLAETSFPPDPLVNVRGLLDLQRWWLLGDGYGLIDLELRAKPLHMALTPALLGLALTCALVALRRDPRSGGALLLALAVPLGLVSVGTSVHRYAPLFWGLSLLVGLGVSCAARTARRERLVLALCGAAFALALVLRADRVSQASAAYRSAMRAYQHAAETGDAASRFAGQTSLARAIRLVPDGAPWLALAALVAQDEGDDRRAALLLNAASRDPWFDGINRELFPPRAYDALLDRRRVTTPGG